MDTIESVTGQKFANLTAEDPSPLVPVDDHQDIVDPRRKALAALGVDVRWR
jgi:hypothetical protein